MDSADLNVLRSVLQWQRAGQRVVLYCVVETGHGAPGTRRHAGPA